MGSRRRHGAGKSLEKPGRWGAYASIVVIFHGVGEHEADSLIAESLRGAQKVDPKARLDPRPLAFEGVPIPAGVSVPLGAACIVSKGLRILVVPLIWSAVRERVAHQITAPGGKYPLPAPAAVNAVQETFVPMLRFGWDVLRCAGACTSQGRAWIVGLAGIGICLGTLSLCGGVVWAYLHLSVGQVTRVLAARSLGAGLWAMTQSALVMLVPLTILYYFVRWMMRVCDLPGDVAFYVGHARERSRLRIDVSRFLEFLSWAAPKANMCLLAHSLGGVLAAESLAEVDLSPKSGGGVVLVTLGCPLRRMRDWFSAVVPDPDTLAGRLLTTRAVRTWVNLWQPRDYVGKRLFLQASPIVTERAVGRGGHGGYLALKEVWDEVFDSAFSQRQD